jgi:hypothetical protein
MRSLPSNNPDRVARDAQCESERGPFEPDCEEIINIGPGDRFFRLQSRRDLRAAWIVTWIALILLGTLMLLMAVIISFQRSSEETEEPPVPISERLRWPAVYGLGIPAGDTTGPHMRDAAWRCLQAKERERV